MPRSRSHTASTEMRARRTKYDEEEAYENESLASALESNDAGRHVARIAHLYFDRMPSLTQADYELHLISLVRKVLGPSPMPNDATQDWGWLGSVSHLHLPKSLREEINRDLESTFNKDKWPSEEQKAFRVFQLLDPHEPNNLFSVVFKRPKSQYQYLFPISDLPPRTEQLLNVWRSGLREVHIPALYAELCGDVPRSPEGFLQLDLSDWFTFRIVNWYVGNLSRTPSLSTGSSSFVSMPANTGPALKLLPVNFATATVQDIFAGNPALELLTSFFEVFLPHSGDSSGLEKRPCSIFRWCIL
jgi:hypothetical protein